MRFTGGLPETACGTGSTLKVTENLRHALPALLQRCGIRRLLDAPCGDCNWISETDLTGIEYMGVDQSRENLATAIGREPRAGYAPKMQVFLHADIDALDFLPFDGVMCRDFFQHLPTATAARILQRITSSCIGWLLATSFDNQVNHEIDAAGFRPLNLQAAPFNLCAPEYAIEDPPGSGRIFGAWRLAKR